MTALIGFVLGGWFGFGVASVLAAGKVRGGRGMRDSQTVGMALLKYRDDPPYHNDGTIVGQWYEMGEIMAIIMHPKTEFSTGEYLTRLAHLMGVDEDVDSSGDQEEAGVL